MFKSLKQFLILLGLACIIPANAEKVDPNHVKHGGYGYCISSTSDVTLWWSEAAYKVMKDAPVPVKKKAVVSLESAKNEWESFILVFNPGRKLENVQIELSDMQNGKATIPASMWSVRKVEYVNVTHPTDNYGFTGKWPDPLPLYKGGETLEDGVNQPFWITLKVPTQALAGKYQGKVRLSADNWSQEVQVELNVWDFELPDTPTLRSGFGLNMDNVSRYNNLKTDEQKRKVFDMHMKAFSDYKISPYNPFTLDPIKETVTGVDWQGGFFDSKEKHDGKYAYMIVDNSYNVNVEASLREKLPIQGGLPYQLSWWAKSKTPNQSFVVGVECYDMKGELQWFESHFEEYVAGEEWKQYSLNLGKLTPETKQIMIRLYPAKRTSIGESLGTMWFDDVQLVRTGRETQAKAWVQGDDGVADSGVNEQDIKSENLLLSGNFEVDVNKINIELDFSDFKNAAQKYMGAGGFNSYRLNLKGLGGGNYYTSSGGVFEGFEQGTEEYNRLMKSYLQQIQKNLDEIGILGKEYIYWFDEPGEADYPFIHETNKMLKTYAPKLTTFLTEHITGQDISDVTDISCTIWHKLDHEKARKMHEKQQEYWSYLCCWPKSPWISEFIDHDAINFRMWIWASYVHHLKGILVWQTTYWNSVEATPDGFLQNPWDEAMSWVSGYGWIKGKQTVWGNGDGRLFYPENRDVNNDKNVYDNEVIPSLRLEVLRDGIEDYEYMIMLQNLVEKETKQSGKVLKAKRLLQIPQSIYTNEQTYNKDPQAILKYRKKLAEAIVSLMK